MNINDFILNKLPAALNEEATDGVECVLQLNLSEPFTIQINDSTCAIQKGENTEADVILMRCSLTLLLGSLPVQWPS